MKAHPEVKGNWGKLLGDAEAQARQIRQAEGRAARQRTYRQRRIERARQSGALLEEQAGDGSIEVIQYVPSMALGVADTRFDVRFTDPTTGGAHHVVVYLPIYPGATPQAIAARLAGAIADEWDRGDYEGTSSLYMAVMDAVNAGNVRYGPRGDSTL